MVGFSSGVATLLLSAVVGGVGLPFGVPPAPEDPMLGRVAPEKCLFYLSWAGTASPDLTSPNQTEQLLAEPEVQNFLKQMRVGLRAAMIKSWPTPTVFAAEPLPPNGAAAWIAPFDFVYDILQCAATNPGAVFVTRKKPNDDATRTSPPGDKTESKTPSPDKVDKKSLVERLADEIDWGGVFSLGADAAGRRARLRKAAEEEERTKSTIVPLDGDDWYCHFDERVFLAVRGGYLIVASCETTLTDTLARMKNEPPRWWTEVSQQLPIERRSVTIYADLQAGAKLWGSVADSGILKAPKPLLEMLGLSNARALVEVWGMEGRNFANKSLLLLDGEPRGLLQAIVGPPLKPADLKPIPRDALAAAAFRLDPQLAVAGIRASIENLSPDQKEVWGGIDDLKNVLSGDTCRDVLKALGDKWCVYSSPGEGLWPIAVVSLRDPEAIKRSLDKLPESGTSNNGDVLEMTFLPFERFRFAGCDVYCFASDYIAAAWTVTGQEMVFGLSPQSVKAYLARDAKYESMQDAPKIIEPFSGENGPSLWAYSDSLSLLKLAYGTSMFYEPGTTRALREAGVEPKMIDFSLWPSPTALYRHVDPSTATVRRTDRGIEIVSRGTIPMPGVIDSGLLLSAAMAFSEEDKRPVALPSSVPAKPAAEKTPAGKAPEEGRLKLRDTLKGHTHFVFCVAFSPDGKTLASGSFTGTVTLWDVASRLNIATVKGSKPVESVAFSPDGKTLASGSWNQTIKLWDVREGTEPDHVKEQVQPPEKE